jgi:hypothetical protein
MLFDRKHKNKVQMVWKVVVALIILATVLLYAPILGVN